MKHINPERGEEIAKILFADFGNSPTEKFLRRELQRYVPELRKATPEEIEAFADYQRAVYLEGKTPELGRAIASLNPTFVDSLEGLVQPKTYVRASTKENGYRFQLHNGPQRNAAFPNVQGFTRQFKHYDLRMFPELHEAFAHLPVMIGDAEIINATFTNFAGFNRLKKRIPVSGYWPKGDEQEIEDELLQRYFQLPLFHEGKPKKGYEVTLAFHGLFAIADPSTWEKSVEEQNKSMISLCHLPIDYAQVDSLLDALAILMREKELPTRTARRKTIRSQKDLKAFVREHERKNLEGVCVVRSGEDDFSVAQSVKIKMYETIDAVVLGLYLDQKANGLRDENVKGALLGLYDPELGRHVPAFKANLDPQGEQVKTQGKREHLHQLRQEILQEIIIANDAETTVVTAYDAFLHYGGKLLADAARHIANDVPKMLEHLPRGHNFESLWALYYQESVAYHAGRKMRNKTDQFITEHQRIFGALLLVPSAKRKKVLEYFAQAKTVKEKKLLKPQVLADITEPLLVEARVFDIKRGFTPYAAGFSPRDLRSLDMSNAYIERLRKDKSSTTDYETIERIARRNTR